MRSIGRGFIDFRSGERLPCGSLGNSFTTSCLSSSFRFTRDLGCCINLYCIVLLIIYQSVALTPCSRERNRRSGIALAIHYIVQWMVSTSRPIKADEHIGLRCISMTLFTFTFYNTTTTVLRAFVRDYQGEPVPEETCTHPTLLIVQPLSSSSIYYDP